MSAITRKVMLFDMHSKVGFDRKLITQLEIWPEVNGQSQLFFASSANYH